MFSRLLLPAAILLGLASLTIGNQVITPTPNVTFSATKTTPQVFRNLENQIGQKFAAVQVNRTKLGIAVGALGRANAYDFKNNLVNDQLSGVKRENCEGVANYVCLKLGLKDPAHCTRHLEGTFKMAGFADETDAKMEEFSLNEGENGKCVYGFIVSKRNSQGVVDISYTIHHQEFKLSARPITSSTHTRSTRPATPTRSTRPSRPIRSTTPSTTTKSNRPFRPTTSIGLTTSGDPGFTPEEWEAISHYCKYEALRTFKQENIIDSISFV